MQELCERQMTVRIHSLWLMPSPADEAMLAAKRAGKNQLVTTALL